MKSGAQWSRSAQPPTAALREKVPQGRPKQQLLVLWGCTQRRLQTSDREGKLPLSVAAVS